MTIRVNVKKLGKRISSVEPMDFPLDCEPQTAGELICAAVRTSVKQYNERLERSEMSVPLDEDAEQVYERAGKIAFGLPFSDKRADAEKAQQTALEAFRDGLFRMFIDDEEVEGENTQIKLSEQSEVTFIRLAMLAGRMW